MKKNYFTRTLVLALSAAMVMQIPAYAITKAEAEARGKVPYSVQYEYQQDYLDGKDVPESALYYEKMVTKSQLEAAGKGPDSVNWRYQEDYLADKPIPESALVYKQQTQAQQSTSSTGEKMVTKSQLEAAGKGPDSVNWRYQEDYLANKPIPESALIYKPKTNKSSSSSSSSSSSTPNQLFEDKNNKGVLGEVFSPLTDLYKSIFGEDAYNKKMGWD
ncbi:MAG: hypothetical protein Q4D26_06825 [Clostridia bacterium]|nr:hypothetical protein [Clostridia bacterium]